ncbi:MAG: hypothetical protein LQ349_006382 [Xanthoria aureola]|nr:MAG: hypothetical protein LQ349_006382 [Xanthoria aureola]
MPNGTRQLVRMAIAADSAPRTVPAPSTFSPTYPATPVGPTPAPPPAQPVDPYGASNIPSQSTNSRGGSQYVYINTRHADTNHLAHSFSQLSTTGYGGYSQGFVPPPRTSSISHAPRAREWSTNRNPTSPPAVSFGSTSADAPESSRAGERRVAPEYGSISAPANALDPIPRFSREGIPSDVYASRGTTVSRHGSSLDAHASPGSYPNYETISASATASGNKTSRSGAESSNGRLDPKEYYMRKHPHQFFVEGKVFIKLHTEDAGAHGDRNSFGFSTVLYEERAYSQLRRFVVVKVRPKEHCCLCVPITTYSGHGATKKSVDQTAHAIIYTGSSAPVKLPGEQGMNKNPLRVIPVRADEKLDPLSRVNLGKTYTVEWNTKVKEIGRIEKTSLINMLAYWRKLNA